MMEKMVESLKSAVGLTPKTPKLPQVTVSGPQIAAMRVRPSKGSKKRPIFVRRESLKKINSRMRGLNRAARNIRGRLLKTGNATEQTHLNRLLAEVKGHQLSITNYFKSLGAGSAVRA